MTIYTHAYTHSHTYTHTHACTCTHIYTHACNDSGLDVAQRANAAHQAHQLYYCVLLHVLQKLSPLHEGAQHLLQLSEGSLLQTALKQAITSENTVQVCKK